LLPSYGQKEKNCDQPLNGMTVAANLKLTSNRADVISSVIKSKLTDAGIKFCPMSENYLKGEVTIVPPTLQYPFKTQVHLITEGPFCGTYNLAYFSLDASLFIGKDTTITDEQINLLAQQIVNDFVMHTEERDALHNKK